MFLILGHSECKFCSKAKSLLNESSLDFIYFDVMSKYKEDWRCIFTLLKDRIKDQKSIPIVFYNPNIIDLNLVIDSTEDINDSWSLIGTYTDLEVHISTQEITIDEDY